MVDDGDRLAAVRQDQAVLAADVRVQRVAQLGSGRDHVDQPYVRTGWGHRAPLVTRPAPLPGQTNGPWVRSPAHPPVGLVVGVAGSRAQLHAHPPHQHGHF
jgi:hypothetical protein